MHFLLTLCTLLLALASPAQAQVPDLIASLVGLTGEASNAQGAASSLHALNMMTQSPLLVNNLRNLTNEVLGTARATHQMADVASTTPLSASDQTGVCNAFDTWNKAQISLVGTVGSRHFLYGMVPQMAAPVGVALHTLSGASESLAWSVLDLVPSCADSVRSQVKAAGAAIGLAAGLYAS